MLPLGRFSVMREGGCEDAYAGIRARHPGVYGFAPRVSAAGWTLSVNVLNLGRGSILASQSSAFSIGNVDDAFARVYLPLNRSAEIRTKSRRQMIAPGDAIVSPAGEFGLTFEEGFRGLIATFPRKTVSEALSCFGVSDDVVTQLNAAFNAGASLDGVRRQMLSLVHAIDNSPEQIVHEPRFKSAQEELLLLHLAQSLSGSSAAREGHAPALHVGRAMDFIHAHLLEDIGPTAIASAAGCSLRNLQLLFAREFGQTITGTLRRLRLQVARTRLLSRDPNVTITGVAVDCGFYHLSDFARHYRREFGENPSQTLVNARMLRS